MVGLLNAEDYKTAVAQSWRRCEELHLRPDTRNPILRLQQAEIAQRRERLLDALGDIRSETDTLAEIALKAGHALVIADPDCIAVETRAGEGTPLDSVGIAPGSCWTEALAGTNGVSLSITRGNVFTVCGRDHFFRSLSGLSCSGAPLRDADGEIIGALSLVCVDKENPVDYVLAQNLLSQTADRIEARLFARNHASQHVMAPAPGAPRGALLALDDRSRIVAATRAAEAFAPKEGLVGKTLEEAFRTEPPMVDLPGRLVSVGAPSGRLSSDLREIAGADPAFNRAVAKAERTLALRLPLLIKGPPGTARKQLAEGLLRQARKSVRYLDGLVLASLDNAAETVSAWTRETDRFIAQGAEIAVLLNQIEALPRGAQTRLATWLEKHDTNGRLRGEGARFALVATTARGTGHGSLAPIFASHRVDLPSLSQRRDLEEVIAKAHRRLAGEGARISSDAMQRLLAYPWPGNLRELDDVLMEIVTMSGPGAIAVENLPAHIARPTRPEAFAPALEDALRQANWNVSRAARLMGISRATINRRIKEAGLTRPKGAAQ